MRLYPGEFGPPRVFGRTLVILCAYRGGVAPRATQRSSSRFVRLTQRLIGLVTLRPVRTYVASMRDHYANPRRLPMQVQLAQAVLAAGEVTSFRVAVDAQMTPNDIADLWPDTETVTVALDRTPPETREVDTVVLVYPDALGLGFERFESRLMAAGARNVVVVNGRRRLFPLTASSRRAVRWRRALASTRLPELAMSVGLIPLAAILAGYDRLRGRN